MVNPLDEGYTTVRYKFRFDWTQFESGTIHTTIRNFIRHTTDIDIKIPFNISMAWTIDQTSEDPDVEPDRFIVTVTQVRPVK